jgi:hypothetical protein
MIVASPESAQRLLGTFLTLFVLFGSFAIATIRGAGQAGRRALRGFREASGSALL